MEYNTYGSTTDNKLEQLPILGGALSKFGGSLGQAGSVSWNFERNGIILIDKNEILKMKSLNFQLKMIVLNFLKMKTVIDCISIQTIFITS